MSTPTHRDPRTVTLNVCSRDESKRRFLRAFEGEEQGAFISFDSLDVLFEVLTKERWALLASMTGAGPMTTAALAERLGRDVDAVRQDIEVLLNAGLLHATQTGQVLFPFDAVHVDFLLSAA
jgi:predicted transcriptional regulator